MLGKLMQDRSGSVGFIPHRGKGRRGHVWTLPPLRERGDDILGLAGHFLRHYGEVHRLPPKGLSRAAEAWLLRCDWPGNVRELSHLMERMTLLSPETMVAPESLERLCLPRPGTPQPADSAPMDGETDLLDEPTRIRWALEQAEGNVLRAARLLGLGRGALRHRMRRYGIGVTSREESDTRIQFERCGRELRPTSAAVAEEPTG